MRLHTRKEIRVVIADLGMGFRGGQRQAYNLATTLHHKDVPVWICAYPDSELIRHCAAFAIDTTPVVYDALKIFPIAWKIADEMRNRRITIFHASETKSHLLGVIAKLFYPDFKLVVTSRTLMTNPNWISRRLKFASPPIDKFVAVCQAVSDHLQKIGIKSEHIEIINSGIDRKYFNEIGRVSTSDFVLGTACTLHENKGVNVILKALVELKNEPGHFCFKIAGTGPLKDELKRMAFDLGIEKNVEFLGFVEDMAGFYRSLDVYILASYSEGIAGSLNEAGACGAVRVGSRVGGIPEIINDGIDGRIFNAGDSEGLSKIILQLARNDEMRKTIKKAFNQRISNFDIDKLADDHLSLYNRLLNE